MQKRNVLRALRRYETEVSFTTQIVGRPMRFRFVRIAGAQVPFSLEAGWSTALAVKTASARW